MKVLVYCGLHEGASFARIFGHFDLAIGFEPIPKLFAGLQRTFAEFSKVRIYHAALSDQDGPVLFNIYSDAATSSIGTLSEEWLARRKDSDFRVVTSVEITGRHLGNFLTQQGITEIDTLVTDVQGFDLTVLRTVEPLIRERRIRCITCEVERDHFPKTYDGTPGNKERDFLLLLSPDYDLEKRSGGEDWFNHDLTWIRKGERDRTLYL